MTLIVDILQLESVGGRKMKKYKLWEVIKMMAEDRDLQFTDGDITLGSDDNGILIFLKAVFEEESLDDNVDLDSEWELVQKPVTFEKVLKSSGRCRVEHELLNEYEITSLSDFMEFDFYMLNLCDCASLSSDEIKKILKEGKWYLED